jgi:hypothetical protein
MEPEVWTKEKYTEFRDWLWADEERFKAVTSEEWDAYAKADERWDGECPKSPELIERQWNIHELHVAKLTALEDTARELYDKLDEGQLIAFLEDVKQTDEMRAALIEAGPLPETVVNLVFERKWPKAQEAALYEQTLEERHLRRIVSDESWAHYNREKARKLLENIPLRSARPSGRAEWTNRHKLLQRLLEVCGEFELAEKVRNDTQKRRRA